MRRKPIQRLRLTGIQPEDFEARFRASCDPGGTRIPGGHSAEEPALL